MDDIIWGSICIEPEVKSWLDSLSEKEFGRVGFYLDLLASRGPLLSEPHTRQLAGKLRELRFFLGPQAMRARRALWDCRENHVHGQRN